VDSLCTPERSSVQRKTVDAAKRRRIEQFKDSPQIMSEGPNLPDCGDSIDPITFEQILEMDDDEDEREFSKSIVIGFFSQAEETFQNMEASLDKGDLYKLHSLGHFLKGSSATLGLVKVRDSCEKIQNYGDFKDVKGDLVYAGQTQKCLDLIRAVLPVLKEDYVDAEKRLRKFYKISEDR